MSTDHNDHEEGVGYGRPPRHTRWRKGQSGNPRGRPKREKSKSIESIVGEELDRVVQAKENGKIVYRPARRLLVKAMIAKAAKGDVRAMNWLTQNCPKEIFKEEVRVISMHMGDESIRRKISEANRRARSQNGEDHDDEDIS